MNAKTLYLALLLLLKNTLKGLLRGRLLYHRAISRLPGGLWLRRQDLGFDISGCWNPRLYGYKEACIRSSAFFPSISLPLLISLKAFIMDSAFSSSRQTIPPSQRRHSLLGLSEKLRELANMQVKPETKDVESVLKLWFGLSSHEKLAEQICNPILLRQ